MSVGFIPQDGSVTVTVNAVDLTDHVQNIDTPKSADQHDITTFADRAHRFKLGLSNDGLSLNFWQDFDAAKVDATLGPLQGSNTPFPVVVEIVGVKTLTMQCLLPNYTPLSGAAGEPSATQCEFLCGDGEGWVEEESS